MKKLNVLQLISSLKTGGAEMLLVDMLKNGRNSQVNFTVVVMNNLIDDSMRKELENTGVKIYFLNRKQGDKAPFYIFRLLNIVKKNNIDIIHSHNYGSKCWSILCKMLKPSLKLVFTLHCMGIFDKLSNLERYCHNNFIDKNIAISNAVLNDVKKFGIKNVNVIYNGIDLSKYSLKSKTSFHCLKIINVARVFHEIKGQDILLKALKICKDMGFDFCCDFVGGVDDYARNSYLFLQKLTDELHLSNDVRFLGARNDIPQLLSDADLFVLPSKFEGFGLSILEAMASGVPVIASNIDGPAELIENGVNGLLFESGDCYDLSNKIITLAKNKDLMSKLSLNASSFVSKFDIVNMLKEYVKLYESCYK